MLLKLRCEILGRSPKRNVTSDGDCAFSQVAQAARISSFSTSRPTVTTSSSPLSPTNHYSISITENNNSWEVYELGSRTVITTPGAFKSLWSERDGGVPSLD